jgi:hypothetical protein
MSKGHCVNNSRYRKESRRKACKDREEYRATLTPTQQLKRLDERLGASKGAKKERVRLQSLIASKNG